MNNLNLQKNHIDTLLFDLDDTLYPEISFVYSGFKAVSKFIEKKLLINCDDIFNFLFLDFNSGIRGNNFDRLIKEFNFDKSILESLIYTYRYHIPKINPFPEVFSVLKKLSGKYKLGIITDGHTKTQTNKIEVLKITHFFQEIIINDPDKNINKKNPISFLKILESLNSKPSRTIYIGDNPTKDFYVPNILGMYSIRVYRENSLYNSLDNSKKYTPDFTINNLEELFNILIKIQKE